MQKINAPFFVLILGLLFTFSKGFTQTPLYLSFFSHNETSDPYDYDHPIDPTDYNLISGIAKEICVTIISKGAKYNLMVDANFITGALLHDNAAANPNDLLQWSHLQSAIDVDPHNHFDSIVNPHNYADLVKLLDSCAITLTKNVVGGFIWQVPNEDWTIFQNPVSGVTYPNYNWQADILWGASSPGHVNDFEAYGIWKPAGATGLTFGMHNATRKLTNMGGGCKNDISYNIDPQTGLLRHSTSEVIANVKYMCDYFNSLTPPQNAFYTANIGFNFRDLNAFSGYADSLGLIIEGLEDYVNQGKIIWATLAEKHDIWLAAHPDSSDFFIFKCDDLPVSLNEKEAISSALPQIFPNPSQGHFSILLPAGCLSSGPISFSLYNTEGKLIRTLNLQSQRTEIVTFGLESGLYFCKFEGNETLFTQRVILTTEK